MLSKNEQELIDIIKTDDVEKMEKYIKEHPDSLNSRLYEHYRHGKVPLICCLERNSVNCAKFLLNLDTIDININVECSCGGCENENTTAIYYAQSEELVQLILNKNPKINNKGYKTLFRTACYIFSLDLIKFWLSFFESNNITISNNLLTECLKIICNHHKRDDNEIVIIKFLLEKGANFRGNDLDPFRDTPLGLCIDQKKTDLELFFRNLYKESNILIPSQAHLNYIPSEIVCSLQRNYRDIIPIKGVRLPTLLRLFADVELKNNLVKDKFGSLDFMKGWHILNNLEKQYTLSYSYTTLYALICEISVTLSPGKSIKINDLKSHGCTSFNPDIIRISHNAIVLDYRQESYDIPILINSASMCMDPSIILHENINHDKVCHFDLIYLTQGRGIITSRLLDVENNMVYHMGMFGKQILYERDKYTMSDKLKNIFN